MTTGRGYGPEDRAFIAAAGRRARARREQLGMQPIDVARAMGIDGFNENLSAFEHGKHIPRPRLLLMLAKVLKVPIEHLLEDQTDAKKDAYDYHAGYRAAMADVMDAMAALRKKGTK